VLFRSLSAYETGQQAQLMANRSALLQATGADVDPRILDMEQRGPSGLTGLFQQLQMQTDAQAYSNVFLVAGAVTLAGILLALLLRPGKARGDGEPVEVG